MKKHAISWILALALCLGLTLPVSASDAGTFGPYTIMETYYDGIFTISFSAAKVEEKTVQLRNRTIPAFDDEDMISPYRSETVTLITLKPDSTISVFPETAELTNADTLISNDGDGKFTLIGEEFHITNLTVEGMKSNLKNGGDAIKINDAIYIVMYEASGSFTDVKAGAYYEDAVKWAVNKKITSGTTATTFSPNNICTVAQILTFLWRANGQPAQSGGNSFSDVKSSDYFYQAALWAKAKGLVSGNKLNPSAPCTRAMVVTYLWKLAGSPSVSSGTQYKPYTLEYGGGNDIGTLTLPMASTQASTLKLCEDQLGGLDQNGGILTEHSGILDESALLITVPSGTKVQIRCPAALGDYGSPNTMSGKWYYLDNAGVFHSNPGVSSECLDSGDAVKDNAVWRFYENDQYYYLTAVSGASGFTDVPDNASYAQAVAWAVGKGITSGTTATTFNPNGACTRGQIVTFLYRAMK